MARSNPGLNGAPEPVSGFMDYQDLLTEQPGDRETLKLIGTTRFEPQQNIKNILITGGAGFIGGWVTRHLAVQYPEYNVVCLDKVDKVSSVVNVRCLSSFPNFHFVRADLTDQDAVYDVLVKHKIDCVLHFAACSHVQNSFDDPSTFTRNNVQGTQSLLDAVRSYDNGAGRRVRRFIHVSTDEVYGDIKEDFVDETGQFKPTNPYSASKAAAEMFVWAYAQSFGIPALVVRSNNVYGPCQYPEKIIPRFYSLLSKQKPLTLQGSGLNVRRYLYGADAADAFDVILHKGVVGEAYNVSSDTAVTNFEVAVRTLEIFGYQPEEFHDHLIWIKDRPFNDQDYRVNGGKLAALGWRQRVSFEQGLKSAMDWYRENINLWWSSATDTVHITSTVGPSLFDEKDSDQRSGSDVSSGEILHMKGSEASTPVTVD